MGHSVCGPRTGRACEQLRAGTWDLAKCKQVTTPDAMWKTFCCIKKSLTGICRPEYFLICAFHKTTWPACGYSVLIEKKPSNTSRLHFNRHSGHGSEYLTVEAGIKAAAINQLIRT